MANWHVKVGQAEYGPVDSATLKAWATEHRLGPADMVRREDMAQWIPASKVTELFSPVPAAPVAPPPLVAPAAPVAQAFLPTQAQVTHPAPVAAAPLPSAPVEKFQPLPNSLNKSGMTVGMLSGAALLLTLVIPLAVIREPSSDYSGRHEAKTKIIMSWDIIMAVFDARRSERGPFDVIIVCLVGSWMMGLAALISTPVTMGLARGIALTTLGTGIAILFLSLSTINHGMKPDEGHGIFLSQKSVAIIFLAVFWFLAFMTAVIGAHLYIRFPERLISRLLSGIGGGLLAIIELVGMISVLVYSLNISDTIKDIGLDEGGGLLVAMIVGRIIGGILFIAAGGLLIVDAAIRRRRLSLTKGGIVLEYCGMGIMAWCILALFLFMGHGDGGTFVLLLLNAMIIIIASLFLFGGGLLTILTYVLSRTGRKSVVTA